MRKILSLVLGLLWVVPVWGVDYSNCQNLFDGEYISVSDGHKAENANNFYVSPGERYVALWTTYTPAAINLYGYNTQGNQVGSWSSGAYAPNGVSTPFSDNYMAWQKGAVFTVPDGVAYLRFNTFGNLSASQQQAWAESLKIYKMDCVDKIKIATTKYNETAFSPLNTALANAISVVDTVVSNTITQAASIATLQTQKQTRPADDTCPAYKQCLLVEDENGKPHWYEITDPFRDFVAPIIANNVAPASTTNDAGYTQLEYIESTGRQYIMTTLTTNSGNIIINTRYAPTRMSNSDEYSCVFGVNSSFQAGYTSQGYAHIGNRKDSRVFFTLDTPVEIMGVLSTVTANGKYFVNGVDTGLQRSMTAGSYAYIFAANANDSPRYFAFGRIYGFRATRNNTLIMNLIPVLNNSTGKYGLYDTVSRTFYGNAATSGDDFTPGPIVDNDADVPASTWNATWTADAGKGVAAGTVTGIALCNNVSGTINTAATSAQMSSANWSVDGASCWCRATGVDDGNDTTTVDGVWVFDYTYGSTGVCPGDCARDCAARINDTALFRKALFGD